LDQAQQLLDYIGWKFIHSFLAVGSTSSVASLLSALLIAVAFTLHRSRRHADVKARVLFRALFPAWLYRSASFRADVLFVVFNVFVYGVLFGWAVLSSGFVSRATTVFLTGLFGEAEATESGFLKQSVATIVLFVAYELGYWTYHYLSHRIPVLWEFHRVHHTAEVLSPITNFRVHPVETILFQNFLAVAIGIPGGVLSYVFGTPLSFFSLNGTNVILLAFVFVTVHLQHSHIWIAATGPLGRVFMSPAHHQLHHSDNPIHFDTNFGSCLAVWDWLFGTLHMPAAKRERLVFGVGAKAGLRHTLSEGFLIPLGNAWIRLARRRQENPPANTSIARVRN
jgi:sterol desaturase/sphingolipid hydroxylase (fatty acid hydroxylase superfamily)